MNKIFTYGDGYATGHIWPEWPQILQALLPEYTVINRAGIGAGHEWLVDQFVKEIPNMADATVIFQWPHPYRFDKLIEDDRWKTIADTDPIYSFNQLESWWLSSQSQQPEVLQYHTDFVQPKQHENRQANYQVLVEHTLANLNCIYFPTSLNEQYIFANLPRFKEIRQQEVQPSPPVHFAYTVEVLLKQLSHLTADTARITQIEHRINDHKWVAYDPDRDEIWQKMSAI